MRCALPRFLSAEFVEDVDLLIRRAERCLEAGADMIMIEADDVCKQADSMRADIIAKVVGRLGVEKTMFEASNPRTSEWFIQHYGPRVDSLLQTFVIYIFYIPFSHSDTVLNFRSIYLWITLM